MAKIELPREMLDGLRSMAPQITELERELARAKKAGLDVGELEARLAELKELRKGLLDVYGRKPPVSA